MAASFAPIKGLYDTDEESLRNQLAQAKALMGERDPVPGHMAGRIYTVGQPLAGLANVIAAKYMQNQAQEGLRGLEQTKQAQRADFLNRMPGTTYEKQTEISGPPVPGQEGQSLGTQTSVLPKTSQQMAEDYRKWGVEALGIP